MDRFVEFQDVCKYYQMGSQRIADADHVSYEIARGEFTIIVGRSGAGKKMCIRDRFGTASNRHRMNLF